MIIFHQARRLIVLIESLLGKFADVSSESQSMICCESLTQRVYESSFLSWKMGTSEKSSYATYTNFSGKWTCYLFDCV